jgi:hypothetical protein
LVICSEIFMSSFIGIAIAQKSSLLHGTVMDSLTLQPLPFATVYVTPDTSRTFLAFSQTDKDGRFSITLSDVSHSVLIHARYLGYAEKSIPLNNGTKIEIFLSQEKNELQEIVVIHQKAPIVKNADTTVYDISTFSDATEYNVEDILKKLPGIQVHPDGHISVNGKQVEKVMIEGADMFGRKYTLGTKNIRAGFLDKVEIIDHYQENPVLKPVNASDMVVLNLKFKTEKKNVINGTYDIGSGISPNRDIKGIAQLNIFSISQKFKSILISNTGNIANVNGWNDNEGNYFNAESNDIKAPIIQKPMLQVFSDVQHTGLPKVFTDQLLRSISTWRNDFKIASRWDANIGISYYCQQGLQQTDHQLYFFPEQNTYDLTTSRKVNWNQHLASAEWYIRHFSNKNTRGLQLFGTWEIAKRLDRSEIEEVRPLLKRFFQYGIGEAPRQTTFAALYSQKVSSSSVFQVHVKTGKLNLPQHLLSENEDYPGFWQTHLNNRILFQQLHWQQRLIEITGRYAIALNKFIGEVEPIYSFTHTMFDNAILLSDSLGLASVQVLPDENAQLIQSQRVGLRFRLSGQSGNSLFWKLLVENTRQFTRFDHSLSQPFTAANIHLSGTKKFKRDASLNIHYAYQQHLSPDEYFINRLFMVEGYQVHLPQIWLDIPFGNTISLRYGKRDAFKFQSWFVQIRYQFAQQWWRNSSEFQNALMITSPQLTSDNQRLAMSAYWDRFIPQIKTNFKLNFAFATTKGLFVAQDQTFQLTHHIGHLTSEASIALPAHFRLIMNSEYAPNISFRPDRRNSTKTHIHSVRSTVTGLYQHHDWQVSTSWHHHMFHHQDMRVTRFSGWQLNVQRELKWHDKPLTLRLQAVNLGNNKLFSTVRNSDFFILNDTVSAIAPFLLISADYAF